MYKEHFISGLITAAGSGTRMEAHIPKLELKINNKEIISYTLEKFLSLEVFDEIILVTSKDLLDLYKERYYKYPILKVVLGGPTRQESTNEGLKALLDTSDIVVCHDGARPLVEERTIMDSIDSALERGSGIACVKAKDTIKIVEDRIVVSTPNRDSLFVVQTPQTFRTKLIKSAYEKNINKVKTTDDASFLEEINEPVYIVQGSYNNIKITTKEDLTFMKMVLEEI